MNIFLIGFMGTGKTYWGKIWAQYNGLIFYDLDEVKEGEGYFRKLETAALHTFFEKENCMIACGGGTPCFDDNIEWMNKNGTVIYLLAKPQYIFDRVMEEKIERPLINKLNTAELLFFIEQKLKEREPFYNQAKIILSVNELEEKILSNYQLINL